MSALIYYQNLGAGHILSFSINLPNSHSPSRKHVTSGCVGCHCFHSRSVEPVYWVFPLKVSHFPIHCTLRTRPKLGTMQLKDHPHGTRLAVPASLGGHQQNPEPRPPLPSRSCSCVGPCNRADPLSQLPVARCTHAARCRGTPVTTAETSSQSSR